MHAFIASLLLAWLAMVVLLHPLSLARPGITAPRQSDWTGRTPLGGLALCSGLAAGAAALAWPGSGAGVDASAWLLAAMPVYLVGLIDDIWASPSWQRRGLVATLCACAAAALAPVPQVWSASPIDVATVACALALIAGLSLALGALDQQNGSAAMCLLPIAAALAYAAFMVGDSSIMALTLMLTGALVGTSFFSFQANLARLGHSGCTLLGYCAAMLAVALVLRNPALGWALPAMLFAHPLLEALALHLHKALGTAQGPVGTAEAAAHWLAMLSPPHPQDRRRSGRRLSAATLSWVIATLSVIPALLWWNDGHALALCLAVRVLLQVVVVVLRPAQRR